MLFKKLMRLLPEKFRHKLIRSKIKVGTGAPENIVFKLAETQDELEQAFRVLHDAYVGQGYMSPHPSGMRVTKYHALPTTAVLIAKEIDTGLVVGTVSIVRDTPLGLPLDSVFPLSNIKKQYNHLAEVSSLAIRKEYRKEPSELLWPLLRYFYIYLRNVMKIDAYVIGVNPSWHDLYTGILGFTKLEGFHTSEYSFVNNAPVLAYFVNVAEQELLFYKFYAHLPKQANYYSYCVQVKLSPVQYRFPLRKYYSVQNTVMTQSFFNYFFVEKTDALSLMTNEEKEIVQVYYPNEDFSNLILGKNAFMVDLRRANRFITRFKAQIKVAGNFESGLEASVMDFSATGLKIETEFDLPSEVELRIGIGEFDSATIKAQVRRSDPPYYGLQITAWDQAWSDFVQEMQSQFKTKTAPSSKQSTVDRRILAFTDDSKKKSA
jgi:hypothetical protein